MIIISHIGAREWILNKKTLNLSTEGLTGDDLLSHRSSTIGAVELDFRVRDGNGYNLNAKITRSVISSMNFTPIYILN